LKRRSERHPAPPPRKGLRRLARAETVFAVAIVTITLLVRPFGDYLVGDEWAYARSLRILYDHGVLRILDWNPMTLITHLLWGRLWVAIFGPGFTVARISTVALTLVELAALAALLRRMGARESTVTMAGLAVLVTPLHLFHSVYYTTDIPTLAWGTVALACYARGLTQEGGRGGRFFLAGSVAAAAAFGVRQSGLLVVAALGTYLVVFDRPRLRRPRTVLACFAVPGAAVVAFQVWYHTVHGVTASYRFARAEALAALEGMSLLQILEAVYVILVYVAFFLLPLWLSTVRPPSRPWFRGKLRSALVAACAAPGIWLALAHGRHFPYLRNKLTAFGFLGPNELLAGDRPVLWPPAVGWAVTILVIAAGAGFLLRWWDGRRAGDAAEEDTTARKIILRLAGILLGWQAAYSLLTWGILFDRHLLLLLPASVLVFVGSLPPGAKLRLPVAGLVLVPLAAYGIAGTHDVHAFSRAAFAAGRDLLSRGVDVSEIDAGYAFDGWHMYERSWDDVLRRGLPFRARPGDAWYVPLVVPRLQTRYVVSLSVGRPAASVGEVDAPPPWATPNPAPPLELYRPVGEVPYRRFWPWGEEAVHTLEDTRLAGAPQPR
jgi:hypothetical protein